MPEDSAELLANRYKDKRKMNNSGCVEELRTINETAIERAKSLLTEYLATPSSANRAASCSLSGAIGKALCYANKREKQTKRSAENEVEVDGISVQKSSAASYRILYLKLIASQQAATSSGEYLPLMNVSFAAQQHGIPIDACLLLQPSSGSATSNSDVTLFQQASDLTRGQFVTLYLSDDGSEDRRGDERKSAFAVPDANSLFQHLVFFFLPTVDLRSRFRSAALAKPDAMRTVDYRAACVCHSRLVDVGFVCSACLSVYCAFTPLCAVCESHFALQNNNTGSIDHAPSV